MGLYVVASVGGFQSSNLFNASAQVSVNQIPEPSDIVILTTPSGPVTLAYQGMGSGMAIFGFGSPSLGYQPNFTYQITIQTSLGTTSASQAAPGGSIVIAADGSSTSWQYEGNQDFVGVSGPTSVTYNSQAAGLVDIDSPFSIPASAYPQTGGVTYGIQMDPVSLSTVFTNGATGGFTVSESYQQNVVK